MYTAFKDLIHRIMHARLMPLYMAIVSFLENTIVLVALEPLFVPVMVAKRDKLYSIVAALVFGCVIGALATYALAAWAYDPVIEPFLEWAGLHDQFHAVEKDMKDDAFLALLLIAITPIPFQLGTVSAGIAGVDPLVVIGAVALGRTVRYGALAVLVVLVGKRASTLLDKYEVEILLGSLAIVIGVVLVGLLT